MLDDEAASAGLQFLTPQAQRSFDERLALTNEGVSEWRTRRNLLASQPMAFNLFGHLQHRPDLATGLFQGLLGPGEVAAVTSIEIERLSNVLDDHTAFDAFATYQRPDGTTGCVAIETKLTEPFSQNNYDWSKYTANQAFSTEIWNTDNPDKLGTLRWSQLFRNHLQAVAEARAHNFGDPTVLVVHHPEDPECAHNVTSYKSL